MTLAWTILAIVVAAVAGLAVGEWGGRRQADIACQARAEHQRAEAEAAARRRESTWREAADEAARQHQLEVARVRGSLRLALDSLRARPMRAPGADDAPRADCAGGTGAELSREDAEFLVWEAARADELRAGLVACYAHVDGVTR